MPPGQQPPGHDGRYRMPTISFTLNGRPTTAAWEEGMTLLEVLREECGVTSPKDGCSPQGTCGCCTVMFDGRPALACLKSPADAEGHEIRTLEGVPEEKRRLLAAAFVREGAVQCGFCTPGIMMRAVCVLDRGRGHDRDAVANALSGHLCRCTGYNRIVDAVATAAGAWETGEMPPGDAPRRPPVFAAGEPPAARVVGTSAPRYRGVDYALGVKPFIADMRAPGMLHAAVLLSAHPRARVLLLDPAPALEMPGVVRVLTAADVPGERFVGTIVKDWPVFVAVGETTRCVGDVLAMVIADSQFHARRAVAAVAVAYDTLPPVTSPEEALLPDAPRLHERGNVLEVCSFSRGDTDAALANSAHVVTERFQTQRIEHAFLEPEACLAVPHSSEAGSGLRAPGSEKHGPSVTVYSQGQGVHEDQVQVAAVLGLPREAVEVELVATGGAFGGKEDLSIQAQTALAAMLTGRPVRTVLTREHSILMHPKRHPLTLDYSVGCDAEGRLTAVRARIVGDTGAYASVGAKVLERAAGHSCGPYRVPNVDVMATTVYTNNPPSGAMRGFGANQAAFAIEGCLDRLAAKVGLDGYDIRERNVLAPGDRFATGQIMTAACGIRATLEAVRGAYKGTPRAGIACGIKNTGIGNGLKDIGRVLLRVGGDGTIAILTGFTEMGQGLFTILRQVVAEETGLDPETMQVTTRSDLAVECGMTTASRATALATMAAQRAGRALATDLAALPLAALAGREYLGEHICDFTVAPGTLVDNPVTHVTFGYATQVVVLDERGRLARVVAAHDVGRAINPLQCVTQIEGSIHMGLGYALSEELHCSGGRPDSTLLRDLGILKAKDTPEIDVILVEVPDPVGGYGAKGVGEIGLVPTAAAVAGALAGFDGIRRTTLPMSDAPAAQPSVPTSRRKGTKTLACLLAMICMPALAQLPPSELPLPSALVTPTVAKLVAGRFVLLEGAGHDLPGARFSSVSVLDARGRDVVAPDDETPPPEAYRIEDATVTPEGVLVVAALLAPGEPVLATYGLRNRRARRTFRTDPVACRAIAGDAGGVWCVGTPIGDLESEGRDADVVHRFALTGERLGSFVPYRELPRRQQGWASDVQIAYGGGRWVAWLPQHDTFLSWGPGGEDLERVTFEMPMEHSTTALAVLADGRVVLLHPIGRDAEEPHTLRRALFTLGAAGLERLPGACDLYPRGYRLAGTDGDQMVFLDARGRRFVWLPVGCGEEWK